MRVRKADSNQAQLVKQMRCIPGLTVAHTHTIGKGFPDLIIGYKGNNYLLEVKDWNKPPSAKKLTPDEQQWHKDWQGNVYVVETLDDVLKVINHELF